MHGQPSSLWQRLPMLGVMCDHFQTNYRQLLEKRCKRYNTSEICVHSPINRMADIHSAFQRLPVLCSIKPEHLPFRPEPAAPKYRIHHDSQGKTAGYGGCPHK